MWKSSINVGGMGERKDIRHKPLDVTFSKGDYYHTLNVHSEELMNDNHRPRFQKSNGTHP